MRLLLCFSLLLFAVPAQTACTQEEIILAAQIAAALNAQTNAEIARADYIANEIVLTVVNSFEVIPDDREMKSRLLTELETRSRLLQDRIDAAESVAENMPE